MSTRPLSIHRRSVQIPRNRPVRRGNQTDAWRTATTDWKDGTKHKPGKQRAKKQGDELAEQEAERNLEDARRGDELTLIVETNDRIHMAQRELERVDEAVVSPIRREREKEKKRMAIDAELKRQTEDEVRRYNVNRALYERLTDVDREEWRLRGMHKMNETDCMDWVGSRPIRPLSASAACGLSTPKRKRKLGGII